MTSLKTTSYEKLIEIVAKLRDPDTGCPWDNAQTHQSIIPNLLEETYEVIDALQHSPEDLKEELGDLLLQIALHSQMASEAEQFNLNDVILVLNEKLISRHPHVFGNQSANTPEEAIGRWETVKDSQYSKRKGLMDGIPASFTALLRAEKIGKRAAKINFDWPNKKEVVYKVKEELAEFLDELERNHEASRIEEEFGDLLFTLAQLARKCGFSAEGALEKANRKFLKRFVQMEESSEKPLKELSREELEKRWEQVK